MSLPLQDRLTAWMGVFNDDLIAGAGAVGWRTARAIDRRRHLRGLRGIDGASPLSQLLAANFHSYLHDDLLVKADRMSMANSLEARAPFLDRAAARVRGHRCPIDYKLRGRTTKAMLAGGVCRRDSDRPCSRLRRSGFGVPLDAWFRGRAAGLRSRHAAGAVRAFRGVPVAAVRRDAGRRPSRRPRQQRPQALDAADVRAMAGTAAAVARGAHDDRHSVSRIGLALSLGLVPVSRVIAIRTGVVAHPRNDRWHREVVPLLGGVGIGLAMLFGAIFSGIADDIVVPLVACMAIFVDGAGRRCPGAEAVHEIDRPDRDGRGGGVLRLPARTGSIRACSTAS